MNRIAIIGPESTGKSELTKKMAGHYGAPWVEEYAREYIQQLDKPYDFSDVLAIAQKQVEQELFYEKEYTGTSEYVFFDTELIITKVWFEYCYHTTPDFVEERIQKGFFDFYLLCYPDLPWEADPVREHGDDRDFFFDWYKREIEKLGKPYAIVKGEGECRFQNALNALNAFINK
ncbi:ATPase [Paludibacter sp. 221]|uniref:AAA family ATPase n=1 Tax=Paludibacter sp. 221 TaxID=2302939 RepID=UPI0013D5E73D|nr:ATP-binding protein [Paludibacter sp. 221]NDV47257.1 ATPase [Paludibacter sp. 221]